MQIVIDIPKETYELICKLRYIDFGCIDDLALLSIKHGTPLPKGHGRLIDVDDLLAFYDIDGLDEATRGNINFFIECKGTIIEADKEADE